MTVEEWNPLDEMFTLSDARTIDEFHRRLVLFPSVERNRADAFEPLCMFRHYHATDKGEAATTAFLLVTDQRWRNATGRIMESIAISGLIDQDDLDLLAQSFLAAGRCLYWHAPEEWFDESVDIVLERRVNDEFASEAGASATMDDQPIVIAREVRPPLRRWAAARLVRRDPVAWASVLQRGGDLDARSGAAIMRGLLDAIDSLPESAQSLVCRRAIGWPQRDVRAAAEALQRQGGKSGNHQPDPRCTATSQVTLPCEPGDAPAEQERLF